MAINKQNLIVPTSEQAQINGRLGGLASVKAKKKRKAISEIIDLWLSQKAPETFKKKINSIYKEDVLTNEDAIVLAQLTKAVLKQDTQAFNALLDRRDGKPKQEIEQRVDNQITVNKKDILAFTKELNEGLNNDS